MEGASSLRQPSNLGVEVHNKDLIPHEDARLRVSERLAHERH